MSTVRIERRFRGPPETGNGGYVAGLVAASLGGSNCTVTLKAPPPLDSDLTLEADGAAAILFEGDAVVVSASREALEIDVPSPPSDTCRGAGCRAAVQRLFAPYLSRLLRLRT